MNGTRIEDKIRVPANKQDYAENRSRLMEKIRRGGNNISPLFQWERFYMEGEDPVDFYEVLSFLGLFGEDVVVLYDHHIRLAGATCIMLPAFNVLIKMKAEKAFFENSIVFGEMNVLFYHDGISGEVLENFIGEQEVLRWLA